MAPAPRRARNDKRVDSDNDESDSEVETPRPQKLRKRVSEAYIPDGAHPQQQEAGFTVENGQRVPLKSVNINDDEAEKRRRRKSAKMTGLEKNAIAGPSSEGNAGATADADASRAGQSKRQQPLNAVGASQAPPKPSKELMATNFEEWMKMATDNVCIVYLNPGIEKSTQGGHRKSTLRTHGASRSSTTFTTCLCCETTTITLSISNEHPPLSTVVSKFGLLVSTV